MCCGASNAYLCSTCGSGRETDRGPRCSRCVLRDRLATEFLNSHGEVPSELDPLIAILLRAPKARSILVWLDKPRGGAECLRRLIHDDLPPTHEALDSAGPGQGPALLRATLVHLGVLPHRNEPLAGLQPWLERTLTTLPAQHRRTLRIYAEWSLLRRARRRAAQGRFTPNSAASIRNAVRSSAAFLTWLDEHDIPLGSLAQEDIDMWLSERRDRRHIRLFLRWAHQRRLTGNHEIAYRPRDEPHRWWSQTEHWTHLRRCLHDDVLPLEVRVTGALMLLYGMPITRIVDLTHADITAGSTPHLCMGEHPVMLPPTVHQLLQRQADHGVQHSAVGRITARSGWLLPGYAAGTHTSAAALARKMRLHGLPAHPSRNTALLALASDLPAAVLSDTLGISISGALQWTRRALRDWNAYLAARSGGDRC
ncbi:MULTISPECIES: hypothetical protein [Streptomyces]|uniref:hypothetical protein n=1 Tax=Streptomyces TaxID=1883 RepID=UPI001EFA3C58|nr:hypothetical protein [Streptomyces sp. CL12-4]MCG8969604.1 hypothetical protein [Streptomyces sp. CL12-4]